MERYSTVLVVYWKVLEEERANISRLVCAKNVAEAHSAACPASKLK